MSQSSAMLLWTVPVAAASAAAVLGRTSGRLAVHWVAKPLAMLLIIGAAALSPSILPFTARVLLLVALTSSLAGDILLMLPRSRLAAGLVTFLLAHAAYIVAFSFEVGWSVAQLPYLLLPGLLAIPVLRSIWNHLGALRLAVIVYVAALGILAWRLLARASLLPAIGFGSWLLGAVGGLLFMLSDSLLARRRFAQRAAPYVLELGAYFAAQWCIVCATIRH